MKHILLTFIITIFTSHLAQAQNEIKARLEYEDAEMAFQNGNYRKTIEHLDNTEKLLGKWTAKTAYLKINALDYIINYSADWDDNAAELYHQIKEYMKYADQNPNNIDIDKMREIYAIEKRIGFAKETKDFKSDPEYKAGQLAYDNKDYQLAMREYLNAANKGNAATMSLIGTYYYYGYGVAQDFSKAMEWCMKAADKGNASAMYQIGALYYDYNGADAIKDYNKAMEWYMKAADGGHASAMSNIGYFYEAGLGVTKDLGKAMMWYLKAADKGLATAMSNIGTLYYKKASVTKDYNNAMEWYMKAADKGHADAMSNIGYLYHNGKGVLQNYQTALDWYNKALDNKIKNGGNKNSNLYLDMGNCYFNLKNYPQSMEWYTKAYETGESKVTSTAKEMITKMYEEGLGVEKDKRKAREWRNR